MKPTIIVGSGSTYISMYLHKVGQSFYWYYWFTFPFNSKYISMLSTIIDLEITLYPFAGAEKSTVHGSKY